MAIPCLGTNTTTMRTEGRHLKKAAQLCLAALWASLDVHGQTMCETVAGGEGHDIASAVVPIHDGGAYAMGTFEGQLAGVPGAPGSCGETDAFLARVRDNGQIQWVSTMGGSGTDAGACLVATPEGVAAVLSCQDTASIAGLPLPGRGAGTALVGFSNSGTPAWALRASADHVRPVGLSAGHEGSLTLVVEHRGNLALEGLPDVPGNRQTGMAILRAHEGKWDRATPLVGAVPVSATFSGNGRASLLSGKFERDLILGADTIVSGTTTGAFVLPLREGAPEVATFPHSGELDFVAGRDSSGHVWLAGSLIGWLCIGGDTLRSPETLDSTSASGGAAHFLARLSPNLSVCWTKIAQKERGRVSAIKFDGDTALVCYFAGGSALVDGFGPDGLGLGEYALGMEEADRDVMSATMDGQRTFFVVGRRSHDAFLAARVPLVHKALTSTEEQAVPGAALSSWPTAGHGTFHWAVVPAGEADEWQLFLYDMAGRHLRSWSGKGSSEGTLDATGLAPGAYRLSLSHPLGRESSAIHIVR